MGLLHSLVETHVVLQHSMRVLEVFGHLILIRPSILIQHVVGVDRLLLEGLL